MGCANPFAYSIALLTKRGLKSGSHCVAPAFTGWAAGEGPPSPHTPANAQAQLSRRLPGNYHSLRVVRPLRRLRPLLAFNAR